MRRLVLRSTKYRLFALAIILSAAAGVRYYTTPKEDLRVFLVDIPPPLETEAGDRDLAQYEFGGHIENCVQKEDPESCYSKREEARKFIESHFEKRIRGYVIVDGASLDLPPTSYFFVEPNELGDWEVKVRIPMRGPYTRFNPNMNTIYYTEVFRRRAGEGELNIVPGTRALVLRSRGVYELLL